MQEVRIVILTWETVFGIVGLFLCFCSHFHHIAISAAPNEKINKNTNIFKISIIMEDRI